MLYPNNMSVNLNDYVIRRMIPRSVRIPHESGLSSMDLQPLMSDSPRIVEWRQMRKNEADIEHPYYIRKSIIHTSHDSPCTRLSHPNRRCLIFYHSHCRSQNHRLIHRPPIHHGTQINQSPCSHQSQKVPSQSPNRLYRQ